MIRTCGILVFALFSFLASAQSVKLDWMQSKTTGTASNNVYRSAISGGPYSEIFESLAPITKYIDPSVVDGDTYCYVVTAVAAGVESVYSNEACETVTTQAPAELKAK